MASIRAQALFACLALSLALSPVAVGSARAQGRPGSTPVGGIYSCTDSKGHVLTADRPIADCSDREQTELNPSGTVRRKVDPTYTAREQADRDERDRQAQLLAARQLEDRRRERALLMRYPNAAAHDHERAEALVQIDVVIQAAKTRLDELAVDRRKIDDELEFYKSDPSKAPDSVRRKAEDNDRSVAVQNRFIGEQQDEKKRVNARFDEEEQRLKPLWAANAAAQK